MGAAGRREDRSKSGTYAKGMMGQNCTLKIWKVLKMSKYYMRYLKNGSSVADRPICALRSACMRRRIAAENE